VEDRQDGGASRRIFSQKGEKEQQCPRRLDGQGEPEHVEKKAHRPLRRVESHTFREEKPLADADALPSHQRKSGHGGHHAEPTELDEEENDHLREGREIPPRVHHHEPRDAHRGGGGEKGVHERKSRGVQVPRPYK
jgi:hypothetical protein